MAIREGLNTDCSGQVIRRSSSTQIAIGGASTGLTTGACPGYRKDHIKALTFGGADAVWNLQWQKDRFNRNAAVKPPFLSVRSQVSTSVPDPKQSPVVSDRK